MWINTLKSKIAYARVTQRELFYVGSITIDSDWMDAAKIRENEKVQIVNLNNGERLETYVIRGDAGTGVIALNGPAARKCAIGDDIFILSYAMINPEVEKLDPTVVDLRDEVVA